MTPLPQRMINGMTVRGFAENQIADAAPILAALDGLDDCGALVPAEPEIRKG